MRTVAAACALAAFLICSSSYAQNLRFDSFARGQQEFTVMVAYGANHKIPSETKDRFSFDLAKLRYGWFTSPRDEVGLEFSAGIDNASKQSFGISGSAGYRRYLAVRGNTAIACDASIGVTRFHHNMSSQGTRTNFTEQLGIAVQYAVGRKSAVTLEYTFSHASNAGLRLPNLGINTSIISLGYSLYP